MPSTGVPSIYIHDKIGGPQGSSDATVQCYRKCIYVYIHVHVLVVALHFLSL